MAKDEKSYEEKVSEELAEKGRKIGEENDAAQEKDRERVEEATKAQAEEDAAKEKALRDYQLGRVTDAAGQPTSGPEVATKSAAGPVEEVAAERSAEANAAGADADNPDAAEEKPAAKKKAAAKKSS